MSLEEFLKSRNIAEETIDYFKQENVDINTILLLTDEELRKWFPKYGDRVAIKNYCEKSRKSNKQSLIETLKKKIMEKNKGSDKTNNSDNSLKRRKKKSSRMVEIGWLCMPPNENVYKQVRTKAGGGTRKVSIDDHCLCSDVLKTAKDLFFPGGLSTKGNLNSFNVELLDYKSHKFDLSLTVREMYEISALSSLRFYLATTYKDDYFSGDDEDDYIPSTMTQEVSAGTSTPSVPPQCMNGNSEDDNSNSLQVASSSIDFPTDFVLTSESQLELFPTSDLNDGLHNWDLDGTSQQEEQVIYVRRGHIFDDLLTAFEQNFFDEGNLKLEMILPSGEIEKAQDSGGVFRDALSEFWDTFYDKCTLGTSLKVPYLRHDFGEVKWNAVGKILMRGYTMENYFPIRLAPVFIKSCFNEIIQDNDLKDDFSYYVCESDRHFVKEGETKFDEIDKDDLIEFCSSYDSKWKPTKENFSQLIRDIAHKELVQKPAFVAKCFHKQFTAYGQICENILNTYQVLEPSVQNCLKKIELENTDNLTQQESVVFGFIKKFVKESDTTTREALFRFSTGSNLPLVTIKVTFNSESGVKRVPIAHTCSGILQIPTTYDNYVEFRSEMNSLLKSDIWIMDLV